MKIVETNLTFNGLKKRSQTKRIIIHHSDSDTGDAATFHKWHLNKGWAGIGYHFVIKKDGVIERGRPEWSIGSHSGPSGNGDSIGICLVGNFMNAVPTSAQMAVLVELIKFLESEYGKLKVIGHKDVMATACPGAMFPWDELKKRLEDDDVLSEAKIKVNGQTLTGFLKDDLSYAPVRALAEALGAKVEWDDKTKTVIVNK